MYLVDNMRSNILSVRVIKRSLASCNPLNYCTQHKVSPTVSNDTLKARHVYLRLSSWTSLQIFSQMLIDNVIYHRDGLVILNKPYGIGSLPPSLVSKADKADFILRAQPSICEYTLSQSLPYVAESLGYKQLTIVKAPEKFTSGVTILSASDDVTSKVKKCLRRSKPMLQIPQKYWAISVGVPNPKTGSNKFGLSLKLKKSDNSKYPVLLTEWSHRSVKCGDVKPVNVNHRTLCEAPSRLASLVEIEASTNKWHFIRVFLAHLLSPVLGDHLHGSRVANIMNVPVLINPESDSATMPQKLSSQLLTALALHSGEESMVPTHTHLQSQVLIGYNSGKDLIVTAPLPTVFQDTCQKLGLVLPT